MHVTGWLKRVVLLFRVKSPMPRHPTRMKLSWRLQLNDEDAAPQGAQGAALFYEGGSI